MKPAGGLLLGDALRALGDSKALLGVVGPAVVAIVVGLLGAIVLLLYLRRRNEPLYGYFGVGALAWALYTAWTLPLPRGVVPGSGDRIGWTTLFTFFVAMLVMFCLRLTRGAPPAVNKALWALTLAAPLVLYAADAFGALAPAVDAWRLLLVGVVAASLAIVARHAWRRRDVSGVLLILTCVVGAGLAVRDWLVSADGAASHPVALAPYTGLLFVGLMAWVLLDRFVRAADALEGVNRDLERRVTRKSEELVAALDAMRAAKEVAEVADRAKTSFLAAASHDLRQPIHALGLYMAAMRSESLNTPQRELVQRMSDSLSALESMFNALLDISRMDAGALVPRPRPFEIEPLLHRLAGEFAAVAADKGLRLSVWVTPAARRLQALSDPMLFERVVRNLLGNALKYTAAGGVLLSCRLRNGTRWQVEVWDTGSGIPAAERERVFDEFYQVGNPERDRASGLGLGLSIVRRLTRMLGHGLALHSTPGRGTRFVLELPVTTQRPPAEPARAPDGSLHGVSVAVIEDDREVRESMQTLLGCWGCEVLAGADEAEVLSRAAERTPPDAVVADFRLRDGHTGVAAVGVLRRAYGPALPALIVTGDSAPQRLTELEASGLPWLPKPVAAGRLRSWLVQHAGKPGGAER